MISTTNNKTIIETLIYKEYILEKITRKTKILNTVFLKKINKIINYFFYKIN